MTSDNATIADAGQVPGDEIEIYLSGACADGEHAACHERQCACRSATWHGAPHPEAALKLTWTETRQREAVITPGQARQLLGLGGTSDDDLEHRVVLLLTHDPQLLKSLEQHAPDTDAQAWQLRLINDTNPGDVEL